MQFWLGFRRNFKQATAAFLLLLPLAAVLTLEIFWCSQFTGPVAAFRYGLNAIAMAALVLSLYLFPTMAAFDAPLPRLLANSFAFAMKSPLTALCVVATSVVLVLLTFSSGLYQPLFAFIWCMIGASGLAMLHASMLLRLFLPYLPRVDICGDIMRGAHRPDADRRGRPIWGCDAGKNGCAGRISAQPERKRMRRNSALCQLRCGAVMGRPDAMPATPTLDEAQTILRGMNE